MRHTPIYPVVADSARATGFGQDAGVKASHLALRRIQDGDTMRPNRTTCRMTTRTATVANTTGTSDVSSP